jgi:hypothetical protein
MTTVPAEVAGAISERSASFHAADGVKLAGTWFVPEPARRSSVAVLIVCGAGIPARFYDHFARYLAARGATVLSFDYRGIGASRAGNLRKLAAGWKIGPCSISLRRLPNCAGAVPICRSARWPIASGLC